MVTLRFWTWFRKEPDEFEGAATDVALLNELEGLLSAEVEDLNQLIVLLNGLRAVDMEGRPAARVRFQRKWVEYMRAEKAAEHVTKDLMSVTDLLNSGSSKRKK